VTRQPNPSDRRSTLAVLTADGAAAASRVRAAIARIEDRLPVAVRRAGAALGSVDASTWAE
jgi:DNA-binding MarR family transcriptional regulator